MTSFLFGGYVLESKLELGLQRTSIDRSPDFVLHALSAPPQVTSWIQHLLTKAGDSWLSIGHSGSGYLLRFVEVADFLVSDGDDVGYYQRPGTSLEAIRRLFLDQVIPRTLSQRGRLLLHASAVLSPLGVIAFMGESGRGKSTLAACLASDGLPMVADDSLFIERAGSGYATIPTQAGVRLWPSAIAGVFGPNKDFHDHADSERKQRLGPEAGLMQFSSEPARLHRIYALTEATPDAPISIEPASPRESLLALVRSVYRLDIAAKDRLRREFVELYQLASAQLVWRMSIPHDFSRLPDVLAAVRRSLTAPVAFASPIETAPQLQANV